MLIHRKPNSCISPIRCFKVLRIFSVLSQQEWFALQGKVRWELRVTARQAGAGTSPTKQPSPTVPKQVQQGRSSETNRAQPRIQWLPHVYSDRAGARSSQEFKLVNQGQDWCCMRPGTGRDQRWSSKPQCKVPEQRWEASDKASYNFLPGISSNLHSCAIPELVRIQAKPL